jgi:dTDP-4-dehydrorhamnose 3,5-epimerase
MADFQIRDQILPNVFLLNCPYYPDDRGSFIKLFHDIEFAPFCPGFVPAESFLTRSNAGVLRGMHFQVGKAAHHKLVYCLRGRVLDVVVDVQPESSYFNKPVKVDLCESDNTVLLIGKGCAHGFLSLEDESWILYHTTTHHDPSLDRGVLWSSIDFEWPIDQPMLSYRDTRHPRIEELT